MPHSDPATRREYQRAYERKRSRAPLASDDLIASTFSYDAETGVIRQNGFVRSGKISSGGYIQIDVMGKKVMAHRLAWFLHHGRWPARLIDHINRDTSDNRLCNLREASPSENQANSKTRIDNTSGIRGVAKNRHHWNAYLRHGGKCVVNKYFHTFLQAVRCRREAALKYFDAFASNDELNNAIRELIRRDYGDDDISYALLISASDVRKFRNTK